MMPFELKLAKLFKKTSKDIKALLDRAPQNNPKFQTRKIA
jgi:hypothetical protein